MKTQNQHTSLYTALETSARTMQGAWVAFASTGHYGLAAFARWEAAERQKAVVDVAAHLIGNGVTISLPVIPVPSCEYDTPVSALEAMLTADALTYSSAENLITAMAEAGENPFFQVSLLPRMQKDAEEIRMILKKVKAVKVGEETWNLEAELFMTYSGNHEW